jgi:SAM-dependent methyltransferase
MNPASRFIHRLRHGGLPWLGGAIRQRLFPARPGFFRAARSGLTQQSGLELGGPSGLFSRRGGLPAYAWAARLDNVNFAAATAWESDLREGGDFRFDPAKNPGRQFLREAGNLQGIADNAYDFVLSSHCLEHTANPLAALREWRRVTRPGGHLLLALPDPVRTFDHRRPVTTLAHLRNDFARHVGEDDLTHLPEILALHDLSRDPAAGSPVEFETRSRANAQNRCLHHHVFDLALIRAILAETGWEVLAAESLAPLHLVAWAGKSAA